MSDREGVNFGKLPKNHEKLIYGRRKTPDVSTEVTGTRGEKGTVEGRGRGSEYTRVDDRRKDNRLHGTRKDRDPKVKNVNDTGDFS